MLVTPLPIITEEMAERQSYQGALLPQSCISPVPDMTRMPFSNVHVRLSPQAPLSAETAREETKQRISDKYFFIKIIFRLVDFTNVGFFLGIVIFYTREDTLCYNLLLLSLYTTLYKRNDNTNYCQRCSKPRHESMVISHTTQFTGWGHLDLVYRVQILSFGTKSI